ncbi:LEAF RUST 10 DISEASE-RESISTANCE LOCUS RECEPTOR-LIKE PROTEIN KINASE-like 1.4 isoform X2 [Gastrolobium bilobum]|uniref:LEAF RUST 10 DISEASE-RESISTANCE LOCUS RECEPTOR-LIKE PROTEIN KINASE-like 1.4 isoform X2 n=1 Tax=Gastrolobium bilobum TaxID=150636 RepID=UPI002AB0197A|nr:LEAF RUST 10 DISEASE-RESISTANCE LOCUS RECEPTOR-LIKE PROTEIN KINASE-like 1.4 isoform X2 [Gastrolobium bilobum]
MRLGCDLLQHCFTSSSSDTFPKDEKLKWQIFHYNELAKATNNFDRCNCRGWGDLDTVYYGKLDNGLEIAIQRFHEEKRQTFQQFINENMILNYLPHKNLVTIYGRTSDEESMLVHEYLSNGTLAGHLQCEIAESSTLPWLTRLDIAIDTAKALVYLHSHGIIHSDITSSNILLDKNFCAKISNFLLSRKHPEGVSANATTHVASDIIGTCGYIDPEYQQHGCLSVQNDVYSFGVVLIELISSKLVNYWEGSDGDSFATIVSRKIQNQSLEELVDPRLGFQSDHIIKKTIIAVAELATRCLQCPLELRPYMVQVLGTLQSVRPKKDKEKPKKDSIEDLTLNKKDDSTKKKTSNDTDQSFKFFNLAELKEATGGFNTSLGEGKLRDGRKVAVKRFHEKSDKTVKQFMNEINMLSLLQHQNLVSFYGCTHLDSNEYLLVYEYVSGGTLSKHLDAFSGSKLAWHTRLNIAIETATSLVFLHNSGIIHRDVKASNILLEESFRVKVADFGLSRYFPDFVTHVSTVPVGTHAYIDPDYYQSGRVSDKSDVYSFGVVLFQLISSKCPSVKEGNEFVTLAHFAMNKIINKALEELVDPSLGFDSDKNIMEMITAVAELAFQCVQCPKELRPSMKQVLEILKGIRKGTWGFNQIT